LETARSISSPDAENPSSFRPRELVTVAVWVFQSSIRAGSLSTLRKGDAKAAWEQGWQMNLALPAQRAWALDSPPFPEPFAYFRSVSTNGLRNPWMPPTRR
jgi:hypothetical protein